MIPWPNGHGGGYAGRICAIAQVRPAAEEVVIPELYVESHELRKWANLLILLQVVRSFLKII